MTKSGGDPVTTGFSQVLAKLNAIVAVQNEMVAAIQNGLSRRRLLIMASSGLQNAQAAVASLQALQQTVITEIANLQSAAGDPDASVQTLADQINASVAAIQASLPASAPPAAMT